MRHSYRVLLKEAEAKRLGLLLDLEKNPENERARKRLGELEKEIEWIKKRIQNAKDLGCYTS